MNNKKIEAKGTYRNYTYIILRQPGGWLCGYVQIPEWHIMYGKYYNDIPIMCYGGLTYSAHEMLGRYFQSWWIGFDCMHEEEKDVQFCVKECRKIIDQLASMNN